MNFEFSILQVPGQVGQGEHGGDDQGHDAGSQHKVGRQDIQHDAVLAQKFVIVLWQID